ncbi:MAG: glycosyltransferase family 4 protein [Bacteroidia bacterium]|nr:glycosyltransferase family 4 protein [Bacteroidia bacterium]
MKILLLADIDSEHTEKWALGLAEKGISVGIFSFNKASYEWHQHNNITVFFEPEKMINAESTLTKLAYLKYVNVLKKIIKHFKPDILHAHYATSYGLVGALTGFHPFVISSWGTDVMKFPNKNFVAKSILKYNFKNADMLCATSHTISEYIGKITRKKVEVVPFGINSEQFKPAKVDSLFKEQDYVIGTVKPMEKLYNQDILIDAFAVLKPKYPHIKLLLVGNGTIEDKLKEKAKALNLENEIVFTGRIPFAEVNKYYNMMKIMVNISEYESFGVSVVEAMACEIPVIVTNVGGLKEVVKDDSVGLKIDLPNVEQTVAALERLINDKELYHQIAVNSRKHVLANYEWQLNLASMIDLYNQLLKQEK